jgi:hypothetical protein
MVNFDRNSYSVQAMVVSKTVTIRAYVDRISFIYGGQLIGLHRRQFGRDKTSYEPWHYLDVLKRKPGVTKRGLPSK